MPHLQPVVRRYLSLIPNEYESEEINALANWNDLLVNTVSGPVANNYGSRYGVKGQIL